VAFKYDPFGRRMQKSSVSGTVNYLYDGMDVSEELDNGGNVLSRYTHGPVIDEDLSMLRNGTASYYQADGLGSITSLSNSAGGLSNTYTYDAFGEVTASTGALMNPFKYTGREFDPETGIYEYRARYFDENIGRFISEDPLGLDGGLNLYEYVQNSPVQRRDALGLKDCKSCGLAVAPEYSVSGTVPEGTAFSWHAVFLNDATHDPACCEVRQYIAWNHGGAPHSAFPPDSLPNHWYEDRTDKDKRYGRRTGSSAFSLPTVNSYKGNEYDGWDRPAGWDPGDVLGYRLKVKDVCNGGKDIYTSRTIHVAF
jgi:RHS repeat-associated protein